MTNHSERLSGHDSDDFRLQPLPGYGDDLRLWALSIFLAIGVPLLTQWIDVENRYQFDRAFMELQNPRSSSGRAMYAFVRRELRKFGLDGRYCEAYIFNEAYIRGIDQIDSGTWIIHPRAWVRGTAYNIIRGLKRQQQQQQVPFDEEYHTDPAAEGEPEPFKENLVWVQMAFQTLDPETQCLLMLRVQGHSWAQVRECFYQAGHGDHSEAKLRKRYERAITKLRRQFYALNPM